MSSRPYYSLAPMELPMTEPLLVTHPLPEVVAEPVAAVVVEVKSSFILIVETDNNSRLFFILWFV